MSNEWEVRHGKGTHPAVYIKGTNFDVCIGVRHECANLIAASPKMLDALKDLLSHNHQLCNPEPGQACQHILAAEAIIAEAERK